MATNHTDFFAESTEEEEEEECRVCRGPAEEGRPLFKPCKCSGSIGLTHQDCLTSWLDVTRGDGKCELCSTRFKFAPQYAEGAPDRLPLREVVIRLIRRAGAKWLPFAIRVGFAASLWLVVLPLGTSYIYHGWMIRPSAIKDRWEWELIKRDTVGGAVISIIIVVSFLSLMSFAEFLRFQWGGEGDDGRQRRRNRGDHVRNQRDAGLGFTGQDTVEGEIDDIILPHDDFDMTWISVDLLSDEEHRITRLGIGEELNHDLSGHLRRKPAGEVNASQNTDGLYGDVDDDRNSQLATHNNLFHVPGTLHENHEMLANDQRMEHTNLDLDEEYSTDDDGGGPRNGLEIPERLVTNEAEPRIDEDRYESFLRAQEVQDLEQQAHGAGENPQLEPQFPRQDNRRPRDDARFEPQFEPLQPAFELDQEDLDDGIDMEINLALDELLGFRGPVLAVVRNLTWLLLFNIAYIGVFAFLPSSFGSSVYALSTKFSIEQSLFNVFPSVESVSNIMTALNEKSTETNLIFQPSQIGKICLGYMMIASSVFLMQIISNVSRRDKLPMHAADEERQHVEVDFPIEQDDFFRRNIGEARDPHEDHADDHDMRRKIHTALDCLAAIFKVVVLIFIKMLLLPLSLGLCLDVATLALFKKTLEDRLDFAGSDLFSALFLHWVAGITFMLLVTVSVLQLREVAHPDILAKVIRPQEPQPDLLGNLLQETSATHIKRILLSLGIYAALLTIHIWLPSRLLVVYNLHEKLPFFQPLYWRAIMPQIQIPAELFLFHLCMLSVLEKYKNNIGGIQHHWLHLIGNLLQCTDKILPRDVAKFLLVASVPVFTSDQSHGNDRKDEDCTNIKAGAQTFTVDPFWSELLLETDSVKRESAIKSRIKKEPLDQRTFVEGVTRRDGKKVLSTHSYIRLPHTSSTSKRVLKTSNDSLLPTCVGPYRLRQSLVRNRPPSSYNSSSDISKVSCSSVIEVYEEVPGNLIPRPPEGWDDLGVGGAESQGRWAWGEEHLSKIEASVATRSPFFEEAANRRLVAMNFIKFAFKMTTLLFISWLAITILLCAALNTPLYIGRFTLFLLRVPDKRVHDPLAFAIGVGFLIPTTTHAANILTLSSNGLVNWIRSFKPRQGHTKKIILISFFLRWSVLCPIMLGLLYTNFFVGLETVMHVNSFLISWLTGILLLNSWAIMCYFEVFTKKFWADLVVGDGPANIAAGVQDVGLGRPMGNNDHVMDDARQHQESHSSGSKSIVLSWQGVDGAVGQCFHSLKCVFVRWEWDKVDRETMLKNCASPVFRQLFVSSILPLLVSSAVSFLDFYATDLFLTRRLTDDHSSATVLFRIFAIATVTMQMIISNRTPLRNWFQAAHKIARDDQYLIGEILLNYSPPQRSNA